MDNKKLLAIKIFGVIVIIFIAVTAFMIYKSIIENDLTSPFIITGMQIISTAEGENKDGTSLWNYNLIQKNDFYINIEKNNAYEHDEKLKSVKVDTKDDISEPIIDVKSDVGTINFRYSNNIRRVPYK